MTKNELESKIDLEIQGVMLMHSQDNTTINTKIVISLRFS